MKDNRPYQGIEQGPIRPPSEADSLCLRITRNCNWNRCTFCPVYKGERFSLRPVDDVIQDIETLFEYTEKLRQITEKNGVLPMTAVRDLRNQIPTQEQLGFRVAANWFFGGMRSVFLQDANSLIIKPLNLLKILEHLKQRFPTVERVTSYARSQTVAKIKDEDLRALHQAGLNRLHIGFESGSDAVLSMVNKGATQALHITAGQKAKAAGMTLSEYYMPGLGGQALSREHALASAATLNQINPDFIRLRSLTVPPGTPLYEQYRTGRFKHCGDRQTVEEIALFLEKLEGITSTVTSDHFMNLLPEVEGRLPHDKNRMQQVLQEFLSADPQQQHLYQIGRRLGFVSRFHLLDDHAISDQAWTLCQELGVTADNVDEISHALLVQQGL